MIKKGSKIKCPYCDDYVYQAADDLLIHQPLTAYSIIGLQGQDIVDNCHEDDFGVYVMNVSNWELDDAKARQP